MTTAREAAARGLALAAMVLTGCEGRESFDPSDPARGPGGLVGNGGSVSSGQFPGDGTADPAPAMVAQPPDAPLPTCGAACQAHCARLALENPIDAAVCSVLWGVGLDTRPVVPEEACRRLYADLIGRFPSRAEVDAQCIGRPPGEVARRLMATDEFVLLNQRRWADRLLYNNEVVSLERVFDMDRLVGKLHRGLVAYDQFAAVASAHPVLTRRHATPGDRAEAAFQLLLGRPPYENERADLARLYVLWDSGYFDHRALGIQRVPDAFVDYRCVDAAGQVDPATRGECTSVLWGFHELVLAPDIRAREGKMWSGLLRPDEWEKLQAPGRILARGALGFWESAVSRVVEQYLGYDLGVPVPAVRERLIEFVLRHGGDLRAAHHAVVTSQVYLQSAAGETRTPHRWTYGPLKQAEVETWIDTLREATGYQMSACDHRLPDPEELLRTGSVAAYGVVENTRWKLNDRRGVEAEYRELARTLGGCPDNTTAGRFKTISVLTTAAQEGFVKKLCSPGGAAVAKLLPAGMDPRKALDAEIAGQILEHQVGLFYGRAPSEVERAEARTGADACAPKPCTAEAFARPICFALLSSAEMLFY